ncbi:site-specific DNA-methyltransferase [Brevundimonas subvibrioides]|uniref:site-specific DNA-methyltransferase n=1 Tax=Brevundimonas subvibrioides TaxID=74313 RepID=UPI0022B32BF2|nr:DNA methyltransferase [Brevundimonas subvibrioides]
MTEHPNIHAWAPQVVMRPPGELKPAQRNARRHSQKQLAQIAASIRQFGFTNPVLTDASGRIVAGHGRVEAAKSLGMAEVPTLALSHLSDADLRAYALADNRLAEKSGWDDDLLKLELGELELLVDFDLEVTGFSTGEMEVLLDGGSAKDTALDAAPEKKRATATVERGDLWTLGDHRLLCGDAREPKDFFRVMSDDRARLVFSDPPYNVPIDGFVGGLGKVKHAEFAMASGEMTPAQFTEFLAAAFRNAAGVSIDGAVHYQCMDWRHVEEMMAAGRTAYSGLLNVCVWAKDTAGMGSFYRSQHELVFVWKVGQAAHLNTVELGKHGRFRTNVWNCRGVRKTGKGSELELHPTVKPVSLVMDAIKDASKRGEVVLDCFGGSGSTLIAAEKTRRRARLIEYEPTYCEVTIGRWEALTGKSAVLAETGETFAELGARRAAEMEARADAALEMEPA